jgi:hypothetical protein
MRRTWATITALTLGLLLAVLAILVAMMRSA